MRLRVSAILRLLARLSFAATLILLPFRYRYLVMARPISTVYGDFTDFLLFASDVALLVTLALWALSLALERRRARVGPLLVTLPLAAVTVFAWLSAIFSVDPALTVYHALRVTLLFGLYLYVSNEVTTLRELVAPVAIQIAIQAVVGIAQVLQQHDLGLQDWGEYLLDPAWNGVSIVWAEGLRSLRAYGLSDHPNLLGGLFAFALLLLAAWHVGAESRGQTLTVGVFMLGVVALLLTFSRAAWVAFGVGAAFSLALLGVTRQTRAAREWLALIAASAIVLLPFVWHNAPYLGVRFNHPTASTQVIDDANRTDFERDLLNGAANQLFAERPLTGVGLGAFPVALAQRFPDIKVNFQPAHVVLLDVAVETGVGGALCYVVLMLAPWLALWLNRERLVWSPQLIGVSALLLAITVVGFADYYPWLLAPGRLWQWTAWGLWGVSYQDALKL
ncbi:MAG: O-antigen ligase family protein [Chloroflexota bacterium]